MHRSTLKKRKIYYSLRHLKRTNEMKDKWYELDIPKQLLLVKREVNSEKQTQGIILFLSGKKRKSLKSTKSEIRKYWNEWERERWLTSIVTSSTFQGKKKS